MDHRQDSSEKGRQRSQSDVVIADGLFIPQQSDQWAWETGEDSLPMQMLQYMQESESVVVGWIHSHPTLDAFLSSVDQHTHFMLQRELPLAFAIVVDKEKKPRVMRLSPAGLEVVAACARGRISRTLVVQRRDGG